MDLVKDSMKVITCWSMHHSKQNSGSCNKITNADIVQSLARLDITPESNLTVWKANII